MSQDHREVRVVQLLVSKIERIIAESTRCRDIVKVESPDMSYNIVARVVQDRAEEKKFLIKVSYDISKVSRDDIVDMVAISKITSAIPVLVGVRDGNEELREDVAYRKMGIIALSIAGFKRVIEGRAIRFVKDRGIVKARVRGQKLRQKRESLGLSLGDVARLLHVSRKTVYEYERGTFEASERTARLLIQYFGEDVLEEVSLEPRYEQYSRYLKDRKISADKICEKYAISDVKEAYKLERAHARIAISSSSERYLVVPRSKMTNEARRVAEVLEVQTLINGD